MARRNRTDTRKLQLSLDRGTNEVLEDLAGIGFLGKNKAEVGSAIISQWIWANLEKIAQLGVGLPRKGKPPKNIV